jgi:site-specific recombinase XerD
MSTGGEVIYCQKLADGWFVVGLKFWRSYAVGSILEKSKGMIGYESPKQLRHSHPTLVHALGVDLKVQQELLRHSDFRTTMNIYTQAVPHALREANSKVVRLVLPAQVA